MNNAMLTKVARTLGQLRGRIWQFAGVLGLVATLTGCGGDEMLTAAIGGYNHMLKSTGWSIGGFSIDGHSGPNSSPESGDHGSNCCVSLPGKWHPGIKVKVRWFYDALSLADPRTPPPPQQAEVEVPEYNSEAPGSVQVHFYPDHRVKVVVSRYGIEHPRYPMSEEDKKPWVTDRTLEQ